MIALYRAVAKSHAPVLSAACSRHIIRCRRMPAPHTRGRAGRLSEPLWAARAAHPRLEGATISLAEGARSGALAWRRAGTPCPYAARAGRARPAATCGAPSSPPRLRAAHARTCGPARSRPLRRRWFQRPYRGIHPAGRPARSRPLRRRWFPPPQCGRPRCGTGVFRDAATTAEQLGRMRKAPLRDGCQPRPPRPRAALICPRPAPARAASEDFNVPPARGAAVMGPAGAAWDGAGPGPAARQGRRPL